MRNRPFPVFFKKTARFHKYLFFMILWAGTWIFSMGGCGVQHPAHKDGNDCEPLSQIIHFYQGPLDHLSAVRYGDCPMTPHCSAYALRAIEQRGPLTGLIMAFDRLIRCGGDEVHLSPEVRVNGRRRTYDPVWANDWGPFNSSASARQWETSVESRREIEN